jgi:hypothetical protein
MADDANRRAMEEARLMELAQMRRRAQREAMSGREPSAEDIARLEAYKPELAQRQMGMLGGAALSPMAAGALTGALGGAATGAGLTGIASLAGYPALRMLGKLPAGSYGEWLRATLPIGAINAGGGALAGALGGAAQANDSAVDAENQPGGFYGPDVRAELASALRNRR